MRKNKELLEYCKQARDSELLQCKEEVIKKHKEVCVQFQIVSDEFKNFSKIEDGAFDKLWKFYKVVKKLKKETFAFVQVLERHYMFENEIKNDKDNEYILNRYKMWFDDEQKMRKEKQSLC